MKILVTGGSGVIGPSTITELIRRGHRVRLLSRNASSNAAEWPEHVEAFDADVGDAASIEGAAERCGAVVHIVGIASEQPPEMTFERINVEGTRNVLREAERAGVKRFIFISSLGADRGESPYHRSKLAAEQQVRGFTGEWLILRPGNVYGPGDGVLSLLLKLVRTLPAIPLIDRGDQAFQPVWHADLARAIAEAIENDTLTREVLEIAGADVTTMHELIARMSKITGRTPIEIPIPFQVAEFTASAASALGVKFPLDPNTLMMLDEGNVVRGENALTTIFGITPTPLDEGLARLAESLPEKLPADGVGPLREKRFRVEIRNSELPRERLFATLLERFGEIMPLEVGIEEEGPRRLEEGATLSMKLPLRGTIQVRVEKVTASSVTLATLEGHPVAGMVRWSVTSHDQLIRFEIRVLDRSGSFFDFFTMETVGRYLQDATWRNVVGRVVELSGGEAVDDIEFEQRVLKDEDADRAEEWAGEIVKERKRKERAEELRDDRAEQR